MNWTEFHVLQLVITFLLVLLVGVFFSNRENKVRIRKANKKFPRIWKLSSVKLPKWMNEDHTSFSFFLFLTFSSKKKNVCHKKSWLSFFFLDHHLILSKFCFSITSLILLVNNNCCWLYIFIFSIDDWLSFSMLRKQHYRINQIDQCFIYHHFFFSNEETWEKFYSKNKRFFLWISYHSNRDTIDTTEQI